MTSTNGPGTAVTERPRARAIGRTLAGLCIMLTGCSSGGLPTLNPSAAPTSTPAATSPPSTPAAGICAAAEPVAIGLPDTVRQYLATWNEHDADVRLRLLDEIWAVDARYYESLGMSDALVLGRAAMSDLIARNQGRPDEWFEPRAWHEGYAHHNQLVMPWRHCTADGPSGVIGTDYAEVDDAGRIALAVGFSPLTPDRSGVAGTATAQEACAGVRVDWSGVPPIVERYTAAWNVPTRAEREAILGDIGDDETRFAASWDPSISVGPAEIAAFIHKWMAPTNNIEVGAWGDGDHHDGWFHIRWRDCESSGEYVEGIEILHVRSDGRLESAASFAGW